jgi:hypothetical protein
MKASSERACPLSSGNHSGSVHRESDQDSVRAAQTPSAGAELKKFRLVLGIFIAGLILSGLTAFPLERELTFLSAALGLDGATAQEQTGIGHWILAVRDGLGDTYAKYPWIGYGTDWLAFAHLVIAVFFIGPLVDPVRNVWVLKAGLIACGLVIPLALIGGPIRGIPFAWRLIDCSFGVFGALPLWYCLRQVKLIEWNCGRVPSN